MAKDPAFLFYSSDFLTGISDLTMDERGQFITLLCVQHQKGELSDKTIRLSVGNVSVDVISKFEKLKNGNYINTRLKEESEKRASFTQSRRDNGKLGGRPKAICKANKKLVVTHKDNLMEDDNVNEDLNEKGNVNEVADKIKMAFGENWYGDNWTIWLNYKKEEFNFKYKSKQSEICAFEKLLKISNGSSVTALRIIHESIANGWKGFFNLTNEDKGRGNNIQTVQKYIDIISEQGN